MIINKLVISNFKNYAGVNEFDLSTTDSKNVILIGGMNGSGKTTISEAVKLCLYGSKSTGTLLSDAKYQEYIADMWARGHNKEKMFISMDITVDAENPVINLTVKREFKRTKTGCDEKLSLTRNGKDVELIDKNYWEFYIKKILPSHISRYFFFDGELIRTTIASNESSKYLFNAIRDLTGISDLDVLKEDILEVRKRISRSNIKSSVDKKIKSLESRIQEVESNIFKANEDISYFNERKSGLLVKKEDIDSELNRALGIKEKVNDDFKKELESCKTEYDTIADGIQEYVYSCVPRIICSSLISDALDLAKEENDSNIEFSSAEYIQNKVNRLKLDLKKSNIPKDFLNEINGMIDRQFKLKSVQKYSNSIVDLTYKQINEIRLVDCNDMSIDQFINRLRKREELDLRIQKIEKEMSRHKDQSMSGFEDSLNAINSQIDSVDEKIKEKMIQIQLLSEEKKRLEREIYEEEKNSVLSARDKNAVSVIDRTLENIKIRVDLQMMRSVEDLESSVNQIYALLKNKEDMVKSIKIQPDYSIRLVGYDGIDVNIHWISEGEKGILMYSVMFGLLNLSTSKLPLIIDSPLGRMDSKHVMGLINYLYPKIGNQVIILSHDREITKESLPLMNSVISKKYLLGNGSPKIHEGYFE